MELVQGHSAGRWVAQLGSGCRPISFHPQLLPGVRAGSLLPQGLVIKRLFCFITTLLHLMRTRSCRIPPSWQRSYLV